jgi:hypothetical protein
MTCGHLLWFQSAPTQVRLVCQRLEAPGFEELEFEAEAWRSGSMRIRGAQATNLVRCDLLIGLAEQQVVVLLGDPMNGLNPAWTLG